MRRMAVGLVGALALVAVAPTLVQAAPSACGSAGPMTGEVVVVHAGADGGVNVRSAPGTGNRIVCVALNDSQLVATGDPVSAPGGNGQWRHVYYMNGDGWATSQSLDPVTVPSPPTYKSSVILDEGAEFVPACVNFKPTGNPIGRGEHHRLIWGWSYVNPTDGPNYGLYTDASGVPGARAHSGPAFIDGSYDYYTCG